MGAARPAMKNDQRQLVARERAGHTIPSLPPAKVRMTFAYGSHSPAHDPTSHACLYPLGGVFGKRAVG